MAVVMALKKMGSIDSAIEETTKEWASEEATVQLVESTEQGEAAYNGMRQRQWARMMATDWLKAAAHNEGKPERAAEAAPKTDLTRGLEPG